MQAQGSVRRSGLGPGACGCSPGATVKTDLVDAPKVRKGIGVCPSYCHARKAQSVSKTEIFGASIYIDWNGKDNTGRDLDAGTYYFAANVVFDVVDPKKRNKTIKGWLQLLR